MNGVMVDRKNISVEYSRTVSRLWSQYRQKDNQDKGKGCFKCGAIDHIAKDCTGEGDVKQPSKFILKDSNRQHGGNNDSKYEMVFDGDSREMQKESVGGLTGIIRRELRKVRVGGDQKKRDVEGEGRRDDRDYKRRDAETVDRRDGRDHRRMRKLRIKEMARIIETDAEGGERRDDKEYRKRDVDGERRYDHRKRDGDQRADRL